MTTGQHDDDDDLPACLELSDDLRSSTARGEEAILQIADRGPDFVPSVGTHASAFFRETPATALQDLVFAREPGTGASPAHLAAARGFTGVLRRILEIDAEVCDLGTYIHAETPLHLAARFGRVGCVELLLEFAADTERQDHICGDTPLHAAVRYNCVCPGGEARREERAGSSSCGPHHVVEEQQSVVRTLLRHNAAPVANATTAVHLAVAAGNLHLLDALLLSAGEEEEDFAPPCHVDVRDGAGFAPLHWAARRNDVAAVEVLARNFQAEVDVQMASTYTPLHLAVISGAADAIRLLLALHADPNRRGGNAGNSPVHLAVLFNNAGSLGALLEQEGHFIHRGSCRGGGGGNNRPIISLLVPNKNGECALHVACRKPNGSVSDAVLDLLLPHTAEVVVAAAAVSSTNKLYPVEQLTAVTRGRHWTPLHVACVRGNLRLLKRMQQYCAAVRWATASLEDSFTCLTAAGRLISASSSCARTSCGAGGPPAILLPAPPLCGPDRKTTENAASLSFADMVALRAKNGQTCLHLVADTACCAWVLEFATPELLQAPDAYHQTPLFALCQKTEIVRTFFQAVDAGKLLPQTLLLGGGMGKNGNGNTKNSNYTTSNIMNCRSKMGFDYLQHCVMEDAAGTVALLLERQRAAREKFIHPIGKRFAAKRREVMLVPGMVVVDEDVTQVEWHFDGGGSREMDEADVVGAVEGAPPGVAVDDQEGGGFFEDVENEVEGKNATCAGRATEPRSISDIWKQSYHQGRRATRTQELTALALARQFGKTEILELFTAPPPPRVFRGLEDFPVAGSGGAAAGADGADELGGSLHNDTGDCSSSSGSCGAASGDDREQGEKLVFKPVVVKSRSGRVQLMFEILEADVTLSLAIRSCGSWTEIGKYMCVSVLSLQVTGLLDGRQYVVRATCANDVGESTTEVEVRG